MHSTQLLSIGLGIYVRTYAARVCVYVCVHVCVDELVRLQTKNAEDDGFLEQCLMRSY